MKLNKVSRAVGIACAAMSATTAFALNASSFTAGTTSQIHISGASAQDNGILVFALRNCTQTAGVSSLHRYRISNNFVYFCTPIAALGQSQSQAAIYKYSVGGSGNGVAPINNSAALPFLDLTKIAGACTTNNVTNAAFNGTSYVDVQCTATAATTTLQTPVTTRIGLSDVEPPFFTTETGNLTADPISTLIFGVPVSTNVYRQLQSNQGLATGYCTNTGSFIGTATAGATQQWEYLVECMPSLSRAQIVSAFTAGQSWAGIGVSGVAGNIYVARRVNSSGTQKFFEALVTRSPNGGGDTLKSCIALTDPFLGADTGLESTENGDTANRCQTGPALATVFAGSGGGNVRTCLADHAAGGRGAIGVLTAEDIAPSGLNTWRFVKVNGGGAGDRGYAPRDADVASGEYTFWSVSSINYTSFVTGDTNYNNFLTKFKADFAIPTGIQITQPFGLSGNMANYSQLPDPKPARDFTGASGLNPWDRLVGGSTLNNCQQGKATNF